VSGSRTPFGINLIGFLSGNFGLAVAGRQTARLLLENDLPVSLRDVDTHDGRSGNDHTYDDRLTKTPWALPYGVTVFHVNPPELEVRIPLEWMLMPLDRRMNVIVPFWELPTLPALWRDMIGLMDVVLAPTLYVRDIIERAMPGTRVIHYPQAVDIPEGAHADRMRFGIPADRTVFLSAFDMASDIHRKNPWSAIDAFEAAFGSDDSVCLVVKLNNSDLWDHAAPLKERLYARAEADPRIMIIDEKMSYTDVVSLYASCDVFISLHRAEGLGLILMEMMSLGKPVVATAWSGNMDFMTEENSCLVGYEMAEIESSHVSYQEESSRTNAQWADPHVDEAAEWMRRLADDATLRGRLGARAETDMAERRTSAERLAPFLELQALYESGAYLESHAERAADIRKRRRTGVIALRGRIARALVSRTIRGTKRLLRPLAPVLRPVWTALRRLAGRNG